MINYSLCTSADEDEMVRILSDVFPRYDPPAVAMAITSAEFESFVRLLCPQVAADQLTYVARSVDTGEMVGALLTVDSASALPQGMDRLTTKFDPIFDILAQLDTEYRAGRTIAQGEAEHLFLLGVAPAFAGQRIAQQLVARCLTNGAARKYRFAITEATNPTSQHIFRKQGFAERARRSYRDYRLNDRPFFASIAEQGGPILMEKSLR